MSSEEHPRLPAAAVWPPPGNHRARRAPRLSPALLQSLFWIGVAVVLGLLLGSQAAGVSIRYTKLFVGLFFIYILIRYPTYVGVGVFLLLFPFPAVIQVGSTNLIFVALLAIAWLVRSAFGREARPARTGLDWAIGAYVAALVFSFVNTTNPVQFTNSIRAFLNLLVPVILFYTILHVVRSERRLLFVARMFTISSAVLFLAAFLERFAPGVTFIPRWYVTAFGASMMAEGQAQRIGGMLSHDMMGDLAAIVCTVQIFMAIRAGGRPLWRVVHWVLALAAIYVISLTGNRGALTACLLGLLYFFWIFRREITIKRLALGVLALLGMLFLGEKTLGRFEGNITLLTRVAGTYLERGLPDTRRLAWTYAWQRIMQRPITGHGLYYPFGSMGPGQYVGWPHNELLFYLETTGLIGMLAYVVVLVRILKRTWAGGGLRIGSVSLARGMTAIWHIAIVQFTIGQMRTDHQRGDVSVYVMWIVFAFGIAAQRIWRDQRAGITASEDRPEAPGFDPAR